MPRKAKKTASTTNTIHSTATTNAINSNKQTTDSVISSHHSKDRMAMSKMEDTKSIHSSPHSGMMMNDNDPNESKSSDSSVTSVAGELVDDLKGIPSFILDLQETQPTLNIMTCGDVSHGKSTLLAALSGEKTGKFASEKRNNMTIRLGYTACKIWRCMLCPRPQCYFTTHADAKTDAVECKHCNSTPQNNLVKLIRHLSFVDVPGHAHLMQTMVSATCVADSAILVIDSSSKLCPGKQTEQHCSAINLLGLMKEKQVIVAQNKIDLIDPSSACINYENIRQYLSSYNNHLAYNTPVIPISAQSKLNIDALCNSIINDLPSYSQKLNTKTNLTTNNLRMNIIRSFDVNRAKDLRTMRDINNIAGGVIGGAVLSGHCEIGQLIEIRPGYIKKKKTKNYKNKILNKLQPTWEVQPVFTRIISMKYGKKKASVAYPGGNVGIQTNIDPSLTKSDRMCGHIVIDVNNPNPPPIFNKFVMSYCFLKDHEERQKEFKILEPIRVNIGSMKMEAEIVKKNIGDYNGVLVVLKAPICANVGDAVGICRTGKEKEWSFVGGGIIRKTKNIQIKSDQEKLAKHEPNEIKTDANDENKIEDLESLKKCDTANLIKILTEYLDDERKHGRLQSHKNEIMSYFERNDINGKVMASINGKEFIRNLSKYLKEKKLNGALFQLFKAIRQHKYSDDTNKISNKSSREKPTVSQSPKTSIQAPAAPAMIFSNANNEIVSINKDKNKVHLNYQQRTGRKGMTTIVGLPKDLNFEKLLKRMKKKWSSGGTILREDDEVGPVIKLNGDLRDKVRKFLIEQYIADKNQILKHGY